MVITMIDVRCNSCDRLNITSDKIKITSFFTKTIVILTISYNPHNRT